MGSWRRRRVLTAAMLVVTGAGGLAAAGTAAAEGPEPPPELPVLVFTARPLIGANVAPFTGAPVLDLAVDQLDGGRFPGIEVALSTRPPAAPESTTVGMPAPAPVPPVPAPAAPLPAGPSDAALAALRACESGGDYTIVSYGGLYRGAYQFSQSTWDSVASRWIPGLVGVDPARATPAEQDALARALYAERGWAPWPTCGLGQ